MTCFYHRQLHYFLNRELSVGSLFYFMPQMVHALKLNRGCIVIAGNLAKTFFYDMRLKNLINPLVTFIIYLVKICKQHSFFRSYLFKSYVMASVSYAFNLKLFFYET